MLLRPRFRSGFRSESSLTLTPISAGERNTRPIQHWDVEWDAPPQRLRCFNSQRLRCFDYRRLDSRHAATAVLNTHLLKVGAYGTQWSKKVIPLF